MSSILQQRFWDFEILNFVVSWADNRCVAHLWLLRQGYLQIAQFCMKRYFKEHNRFLAPFIAVYLHTDSPILSDSKTLWQVQI